MKKHLGILGVVVVGLLGPALWPVAGPPAVAGALAGAEGLLPGEGPWVVRAYYDDPQMVAALASWIEPWEVHPDEKYVVLGVDRETAQRLLDMGFRLEVDQAQTGELQHPQVLLPGQTAGIPGYPCYRTVEETFAAAEAMAAAHPNLATWIDAGNSWDKEQPGGGSGHDIKVLRLTNAAIPGPKPALFVMASIHAREYAPAELSTRFAEYLVDQYGVDADVTWLLDYHQVHLLLQGNPDGRKIAETGSYWRKNVDDDDGCTYLNQYGVDLNRNFPFQWGCCGGSSPNPCNEVYRGPNAASEPETQAVMDYVRGLFPDQRADDLSTAAPANATGVFIDLHSYSELVLWPWGFTPIPSPNASSLQTLGRKFAYWNHYKPEQAMTLYATDGATDDFAYGDLGVAAFTFEVGTSFFQDCNSFENTIVPDNMAALVYAAKVARTPYQTPAGPDALAVSVSPTTTAAGGSLQLTATVDDRRYNQSNGIEATQNVAAAEYYVDVPPWASDPLPVAHALGATDGAFDAKAEAVQASLDTSGLAAGRHVVFVRGRDATGQWGAFTATFFQVRAVDYDEQIYLPLVAREP